MIWFLSGVTVGLGFGKSSFLIVVAVSWGLCSSLCFGLMVVLVVANGFAVVAMTYCC
jgi:hypothetical protein